MSVGNSKADRWLRGDRDERRARIAQRLQVARVHAVELPIDDYRDICWKEDQYRFLVDYQRHGRQLDFATTIYYQRLLRAEPYSVRKRRRIMTSFPSPTLEESVDAWARARLDRYMDLYDSISSEGWRFDAAKPGRQSYICVIEPPLDEESLRLVFGKRETGRILAGERKPYRLIDGHHRLACLRALGRRDVPTLIHVMERRPGVR